MASGALAGSALALAASPAVVAAATDAAKASAAQNAFRILSTSEADTLGAVAAQIIPTDDTPGATEAGVVYFIDEAFATFMRGALETTREQLAAFESGVASAYEGKSRFVELSDAQQIAYLHANEDDPLFGFMQFLTTLGMFALPSYGGNRHHAGWSLIGFKHQHVWFPPFGHYDANDGDAHEQGRPLPRQRRCRFRHRGLRRGGRRA
ncbi:MAG: gluconate 2-dehydrogenase subunit 3 family protein, partial [Pseudomonadota bacterium]